MTRRLWAAVAAAISLLAVAGAGFAQDPAYLAQYKLYNKAFEAGDRAAATEHARAAWMAAESELGDSQYTAVLAYNYGRLILFTDAQGALAPLTRAKQLTDAGVEGVPVEELNVHFAFADFMVDKENRRKAAALRDALEALEAVLSPSLEDAYMWLQLAYYNINKDYHRNAVKDADKTLTIIDAVAKDDAIIRPQALLIRGIGTLVPTPRSIQDIASAYDDFTAAHNAYPPQESVESFEPTFALVIAWQQAAYVALRDDGRDYTALAARTEVEFNTEKPVFTSAIGAPEDCGGEWAERKPPRFPEEASTKNYIGAVILIYDIADNGDIVNVRVLSEVPSDAFGETALKSVSTWRLGKMPEDHPGCRKNQITHFAFMYD